MKTDIILATFFTIGLVVIIHAKSTDLDIKNIPFKNDQRLGNLSSLNESPSSSGNENIASSLEVTSSDNSTEDRQSTESATSQVSNENSPTDHASNATSTAGVNSTESSTTEVNSTESSTTGVNSTESSTIGENSSTEQDSTKTSTSGTTTVTPPEDKYFLKDDSGYVCILMKFDATFDISYNKTDKKSAKHTLEVPKNASVDPTASACGENLQKIVLLFDNNSFAISFNLSSKKVFISELKLDYLLPNDTFGPIEKGIASATDIKLFSVAANTSYKCDAKVSEKLSDDVTLHFENYQAEAFMHKIGKKEYDFDKVDECGNDDLSQAIPIAVGCALAGLVILVLIAYVVGKRRNDKKEEEEKF